MPRTNANDLSAFLMVASERSFTKAAAKLGVTPSALSHTIKGLEQRLGVRLLARTTRSVAPTTAGERLATSLAPLFEQMDAELEALSEQQEHPRGTIRLSCTDYFSSTILRERITNFLQQYPSISIEIVIDSSSSCIVEDRFDAVVRSGESLSKDMLVVRIGPDWRFSVVGSPAYFRSHPEPKSPEDLSSHQCINLRQSSSGDILTWDFAKGGRELSVGVEGQMTFNTTMPILDVALDGIGLGYLPEPLVRPHLKSGQLKEVLADWCSSLQGYHLYYPNKRGSSPALALLVDALQYRE